MSDAEERAAHLARAAQEPDAATARTIARAARATNARGAPGAAAELAEHAQRLTPPDDRHELWSLTIDTADFSFQAGDMPATHRRLDEALQLAAPGDERSATLQHLALLATCDGSMEAARELGERALAGPTADAETLVLIHRRLSVVNLLLWDLARAERHARSAARLAEAVGRPELLARTTASLCFVRRMRGRPFSRRRFDEALRATVGAGPAAIDDDPTAIHALMLMYEGELQEAGRRLCACMRGAEERGDEPHVAGLAFCLSELECRAGNFREAADLAARAVSASDETGQLVTRAPSLFATALADSYLGHADAARSAATTGLAIAERTGHRWAQAQNRWVLGSLALAAGDLAEADAQLGRVVVSLDGAGIGEPGVIPVHGDEIEALIALGRTTEACQMLKRFRARPLAPWLRARTERQAGLLLATAGQLDPARDLLRAAVAEQARLDMRFDRARTLLVLGQVLRRAKSKRESRETLQHAVAAFDELGAALWAQRARAELGRIGGRGPASHELTASERRVAERVAAWLSNKEVAAELFVAVRTVEAHLSRVYRKLGVRSRGQLAQRLAVSGNE